MFSRRFAIKSAFAATFAAAPILRANPTLAHTQELMMPATQDDVRNTLLDEVGRFGVQDWAEYKQDLFVVETLLRNAGVDAATVRRAILDLDEAAVGLYVSGRADALDLGMEAGRMMESGHPFVMHLPGGRVCRACNGGGGQHDGPACDGRIDDDEPCSQCQGTGVNDAEPIVLIFRPGHQDEASRTGAAAAAA